MILEWFSASEVIEVGTSLADYLLSKETSMTAGTPPAHRTGHAPADMEKFLRRAARDVRPLRLNLFKRAKLLETFKWRLLDNGCDPRTADELTQLLLLQVTGGAREPMVAENRVVGPEDDVSASRRLPALVAEADARFEEGDYARSIERLQQALAANPRNAVAHAKLGAALTFAGRYHEAEEELRRALELKPTLAEAHFNLGTLLRWKGNFAASETLLRRAVKLDPKKAETLASLGLTLAMRGRVSDARRNLESALRLKPRNVSALSALGWLAGIEGRLDEAEKLQRSALEIDPRKAAAWAALPAVRRMTTADKDWLQGAERTLASDIPPLEEARLRFAMGKYFDDLGDYAHAFRQYKRGNEIFKLVAQPYDRAARTAFVDDMIGVYTPQRLTQIPQESSESAKPVFVTGMMRSGTSLVEQIIASHPNAVGAGELEFWNATAHKKQKTLRREPPDGPLTRELADSYLRILAGHSADALRVVDKATFNSDYLGLIHRVLPQARIIYLRRDPIDTCLSCYFQDFASVAAFTLDLDDLAHYYREHHRLIAHWRFGLPQGTLLEVPYAELVADQEVWSRRIIEFIGLEWDPRCLEFHETARPVLTASNWQVRQRIYSSSVGRWRNYQKFIGPLLELQQLAP